MASPDEFWKELYEKDPTGYEEHLKAQKKWQKEFARKDHAERTKVANLFLEPAREDMQQFIDELSNEELLNIYFHLERVKKSVEKRYHQNLDETVFSVSHTPLKEVVLRHSWEAVRETFLRLFPDQEKSINGYEHVYNELGRLVPTSNEGNFVITMRLIEEDEEAYYDISGRKKGDLEFYALDFTPWEEWLGFFCDEKSLQAQGELTFIAHCLWEMTFDGFEQSQIQENLDELKKRAEENKKDRP